MLDTQLQSLLSTLRTKVRRYVLLDSALAVTAIVLGGFLLGCLIDYGPVTVGGTEMPRTARGVLLGVVIAVACYVFYRLLLARIARKMPDEALALLLERQHPDLEGRLITAVQLSQADRQGDSFAPQLLDEVHRQAKEASQDVDISKVFSSDPLIQKAIFAVPLLLIVLVFGVASPTAFLQAVSRLTLLSDARWPRRADLEMVGVELSAVALLAEQEGSFEQKLFEEGVVRLPVSSSATLRIKARADDAVVPTVCTVYYETDDGVSGQANMRRVGRQRDGYQYFVLDGPPLRDLNQSFQFTIIGLDDRLDGFRVEAIEPPVVQEMTVRWNYPDYLREKTVSAVDGDAFDRETRYQAGLRIEEGSAVRLQATSSVPLGDVAAVVEYANEQYPVDDLTYSDDRTRVELTIPQLTHPTLVQLVPADQSGISTQSPLVYSIGAVLDQSPETRLQLQGIQSAITPEALLPFQVSATDDHLVTTLNCIATITRDPRVVATDADDDEAADQRPADTKLTEPLKGDADGNSSGSFDMQKLAEEGVIEALIPGDTVSIVSEAQDGYNLDGEHVSRSEVFRLEVVTSQELLAMLERRELGLRTRLEQTITELRGLRDQLRRLEGGRFEIDSAELDDSDDPEESTDGEDKAEQARQRALQVLRLRVQQNRLQASKTTEELLGITNALDQIVQELMNNRIDSQDRQDRLGEGVKAPLLLIVEGRMNPLKEQILAMEQAIDTPEIAVERTQEAIATVEQTLLELDAVLEKMLDLESYAELLDLVRGLIDEQEKLKKDTQKEQADSIQNLFDD